jgi:hypothetical protein
MVVSGWFHAPDALSLEKESPLTLEEVTVWLQNRSGSFRKEMLLLLEA